MAATATTTTTATTTIATTTAIKSSCCKGLMAHLMKNWGMYMCFREQS